MGDHKAYRSIDVLTFDSEGIGPSVEILRILANVSPNENYPESRISLAVADLCNIGLTIEESAALRAQLEAAERDVVAGCPSLAPETKS